MKIPPSFIPQDFIDAYNLEQKFYKNHIYYRLPTNQDDSVKNSLAEK